jgi:tetratricopeptide (TPR) repeat protein
MRDGRLQQARKAFAQQFALDHEPAFAHYNTACTFALAGELDCAMASLRLAVDAGFDSLALIERDHDLKKLHGRADFLRLRVEVMTPRALHARIVKALQNDRFEETLGACNELLATDHQLDDQQLGWIHHRLGLAHFGLGDTTRAARAFSEQVRLGFWIEEGLYRLACCHAVEGRSRTAIAYLQRALDAGLADGNNLDWLDEQPTLAEVVKLPAYERIKQRAYDQSILEYSFKAADWRHLKELREAEIAENPYNGAAHLQLTWSYLRLREYDKAIDAAKAQHRMGYLSGVACYNVACGYALKNELDNAMDWLERARDNGFYRPELRGQKWPRDPGSRGAPAPRGSFFSAPYGLRPTLALVRRAGPSPAG